MLLKGKAELRQAAEAFAAVEKLNRFDGPLNLARVYYREGRLDEAVGRLAARGGLPRPRRSALDAGLAERPGESRAGTPGRSRAGPAQRAGGQVAG